MKRLCVLIVVIITIIGMQLPAEGTAEVIHYAKDISGRTDDVSLFLQNITESHAIESGSLKIRMIPMSSETYVLSAYPDMKARRYNYGQMKDQVLSIVRNVDDFWDTEKLADRTFIMIISYEKDAHGSGPNSYTIDEDFFNYMFLDNDKSNFLRVCNHNLEEPFVLDENNSVLAVMVSFGEMWLDHESLAFLQEAESLSLTINAFGFEEQAIVFDLPLGAVFSDIPEGPKRFLDQLRSDITVYFNDANIPPLRYQSFNATIDEPVPPIKEGYSFGGWYTDKQFLSKWDFPTDRLRNEMTLYAKWIPISYSVKLKLDDDIIQVLSITHGDKIIGSQIQDRQGYKLEGLYSDPNYIQTWDLNKERVRKETILYTKWKKINPSFRIVNDAEPESLDPHQIQGVPEHRLYTSLFEGLVIYNPEDASTIPGLAESWTIDESGTIYTFKLRDASWSDGVKITAQTFVDSWLRILNPATASPYSWYPCMFLKGAAEFNAGEAPASSVGIRALDDSTFQMELLGPLPYTIGTLAHYSFAAVPMHAIAKYGDKWINPENFVGNGPFVLKEWIPQSLIRVVKNNKYWDADAVKLDEVIFYATDDNNTAYTMYLNGEVDWINTVPLDQLEAASLRKDYHNYPQLSTYYYEFQNERAPMNDVRVRKAFSMSVDRQALVDKVTRGGQIPAWGIVPAMAGYPGLGEPVYDVAVAKKLLAAAGYPNGVGFPKTSIIYNTSESHKVIAQFLQQEWKKNLGVNVELENQEWTTYLNNRNEGNFQIARAGWVGDYQDPTVFLDMFITGGAMNGSQFSNEQFDLLLNVVARMGGPDRLDVLTEAEYILINQEQAILPLYYYTTNNMIDTSKWGGWYPNTMDYHPLKNIYLR